jgi:hypothetical protein
MANSRRTRTVVKNRYQRTGPRATIPAAHRGKPGTGGRRSISSALRYIQVRPLGQDERPEDRAFFGRERDGVSRAEAREHLAERVTRGVAYHSMVLSPGVGAEGMSREELQTWTRAMMADLERRMGRDLVWYAVVHRHNAHPHAHVIVGASTSGPDGRQEGVRFGRADFQFMREQGDHHFYQMRRDDALLRDAEQYLSAATRELAALLARAVTSGGAGGGGPTDRDRIERSRDERDRDR